MSISITGLTPTMIAYETMLVLPCWMHSKNCYVLVMPFFSRRYSDMKHIDLRDKLSLLLELSLSSINRERAICSTEKERNLTYIIYRILSPISDILLLNKACSAATAYNLRSTAPWRWLAICLKHSQVPASIISDLTY